MVKYRVKELAKGKGLTQFELANQSGVSLTVVQRLWQNHRALGDVRYGTLTAIAEALGVKVDDLFAGEDDSARATLRTNRESLEFAATLTG